MKKIKRLIKRLFIGIGSLILLLLAVGFLFLNLSPQFGGTSNEQQVLTYERTGHFRDGIFINEEEIEMELNCHSITQMLKESLEPDPNVAPKQNIEVQRILPATLVDKADSLVRITWFGHSSFLIEMDGKNILLDPVFGDYAAPHPLLGRKRYNNEMPISIEELPPIDAILISHDHYDHLDYPSIVKLRSKTDLFYVPLGVGNHLRAWEISADNIHELDWWQEDKLGDIEIAFTPSRHMSGRGLSDQSSTLWGSWVLKGKSKSIYFSGDGGYGKHFKEIGEKYGPFDVGLMECGQYNELWADVHMMPEQTVQAAIDVRASMIIPIHWGAFTLATHSWTDPIERVTKQAQIMDMAIATPQIGESLITGASPYPKATWWESVE